MLLEKNDIAEAGSGGAIPTRVAYIEALDFVFLSFDGVVPIF